jgi:regulator of sirC expression with transglutaminase-like and TPR domain
MESTERFAALVAGGDPPLDETLFTIAAHAYPDLDVDAWLVRVDDLAGACPGRDFAGLRAHVFGTLGFAGNVDDYGDPRNSFLNDVFERRLGIPITLAVVMMELGRRVGVPVLGIGMPGHFLVRAGDDPTEFCDPFARGAGLDVEGCRSVFKRTAGDDATFRPAFLAPVGNLAIVTRVLANLQRATLARDRRHAPWVARLRLLLPGLTPAERHELARLLGSLGAFTEAATLLDELAAAGEGELATRARNDAVAIRARAN